MLGRLILDLKPDVVIDGGDTADMPSLCSYDKGKKEFFGRKYIDDIEACLDFQERMVSPIKKSKRKRPRFIRLIGNHEQRISRALDLSPELEGTIGYKDLRLGDYYDNIVEYAGNSPGSINIDGITYSHYFVAGVSGKPSSGSSTASTSLLKSHRSLTQGHSHLYDFCTKPTLDGHRINSLVGGCFIDHTLDWAGDMNKLWWRGLFIKRNVEDGNYDLEAVSMNRLEVMYA